MYNPNYYDNTYNALFKVLNKSIPSTAEEINWPVSRAFFTFRKFRESSGLKCDIKIFSETAL